MKIVSFDEGYMQADELWVFLNSSLEYDFITWHMFNRVVLEDPNRDDSLYLIALEDNVPVGCLIGAYRKREPPEWVDKQKDTAWIKVLCVRPEHREKPVFEHLLEEFIKLSKDAGKKTIIYGGFPSWHFSPGLNIRYDYYLRKLKENGFAKRGEVVDYEVDLLHLYYPDYVKKLEEEAVASGIVFREASLKEKDKVLSWIKEKFSPGWATEAKMAFKEKWGGVWIAEEDEEILGFSVYGGLEPNWFGPIGVDPQKRRKGLGTILLYKTLKSMRERGQRYIIIPWTEHLFFYSQLPGIKEIKHYIKLSKNIEG